MLLAGMVGSTVGWRVVPYVAAPAGIDELVAGLDRTDDRTAILPGAPSSAGDRAPHLRAGALQSRGALTRRLRRRDRRLAHPRRPYAAVPMAGGRANGFPAR